MSHGVTLPDGSVSFSTHDVLNKWKTDFQSLFRPTSPTNDGTLDDDSLNRIAARWENEYEEVQTRAVNTQPNIRQEALNEGITLAETRKIIAGLGNNKATGLDNIPYEIFKNEYLLPLLHKLFSTCFKYNVVPSMWRRYVIAPILKKGKDRVPLHHRGIALLSTVAKPLRGYLTHDCQLSWSEITLGNSGLV